MTVAGEEVLCRLKLTTIEELGIKISDSFKSLPVYDAYFILKPPVTRINAQLLQEPDELQSLEEDVLIGSVDSEFQQLFENERNSLEDLKRTLEQENRDLEAEKFSLLLSISNLEKDPENYIPAPTWVGAMSRGEPLMHPSVNERIGRLRLRIDIIIGRQREIRDELAESKFDLLSL